MLVWALYSRIVLVNFVVDSTHWKKTVMGFPISYSCFTSHLQQFFSLLFLTTLTAGFFKCECQEMSLGFLFNSSLFCVHIEVCVCCVCMLALVGSLTYLMFSKCLCVSVQI